MALQPIEQSAPSPALPEALARFAHQTVHPSSSPLRTISYVAFAIDTVLILTSIAVGTLLRGTGGFPWRADLAVLVVWLGALAARRAYDSGRIGVGSEEFKNVIAATTGSFAFFASLGFLLEITDGRRYILGTFATGILLLTLGRRAMRFWVFDSRRAGHLMRRTLVIGEGEALAELRYRLSHDPRTGFEVVTTLDGPTWGTGGISNWLDLVERTLRQRRVDAVAISQTPHMTSEAIRRLSWRLEGPSIDLLVAPTLGDVTGPRMNVRPAAGLPLLHLEEPRLTGPRAILKRATDVLAASLGLLIIAPLLLMIALIIRLTSPGPALFVQERVGRAGVGFRLVKFRSMYEGSEEYRLETLGNVAGDPASYKADPRITPFGRFLRRWSLDELPQLWNVLEGSMSLVGPRPMLAEELPLLGTSDHRRHLTKPGMTGLWQVAGRKEIEWSERMQMDLRYVENWSPALDLVILAKTVKAVATGRGAH